MSSSKKKRTMNQKQFWEMLSRTKGWTKYGGQIRKRSKCHQIVCPVCAVANLVIKKVQFNSNYLSATEYLGLDSGFAYSIASAADGIYNQNYDKLLKACKLV